jgi:hypothetical protein
MKMNGDKPVTRKELKEELVLTKGELRAEITQTKDELRAEIGEVRGRVDRVDAKVDRIAVKVVGLEVGMGELKTHMATLSTKDDISRLMGRMDDFVGALTAYDRGSVVRGAVLDDHARTLRDHEGRIGRLETGSGG